MINDCARLCQQSYQDDYGVDVGDLRFAVEDRGAYAIVVFRGSDNVLNWLRDLEAIPARTRDGHWAHQGFVGAFDRLWGRVTHALAILGKPAIFTGHSLGGAIAVLFAEALYCQAVTFGCPRVWWRPGEPPRINHIRVICDDDPVPGVPRLLFQHDEGAVEVVLNDRDGELVNPEDHRMAHYLARLRQVSGEEETSC